MIELQVLSPVVGEGACKQTLKPARMARRGGAFPPEASQGTCTSVFVCQVGDSTLQIISITGTGELRKALLLSYSEPALCLVSVGLSVDDYSPRVQTACRRMHADGGPCPELAGTVHPDRHGMDVDETGA